MTKAEFKLILKNNGFNVTSSQARRVVTPPSGNPTFYKNLILVFETKGFATAYYETPNMQTGRPGRAGVGKYSYSEVITALKLE